jgi:hypothetical protein
LGGPDKGPIQRLFSNLIGNPSIIGTAGKGTAPLLHYKSNIPSGPTFFYTLNHQNIIFCFSSCNPKKSKTAIHSSRSLLFINTSEYKTQSAPKGAKIPCSSMHGISNLLIKKQANGDCMILGNLNKALYHRDPLPKALFN